MLDHAERIRKLLAEGETAEARRLRNAHWEDRCWHEVPDHVARLKDGASCPKPPRTSG
jgi:hypothetical protein